MEPERRSCLLALIQYRFGHAEAVDADRDPAVDRDLRQHRSDFIGREPVAQRAANMGLEFLHFPERGDHAEIEDRALARAQRVVAPSFAQQYWVMNRWKSRLKSSALLSARST